MRTLVIGDIHGGYKALLEVLKKAQVTPKDRLIFLGDYVDGWSQSPQVINHLITLSQTHNCIFLRGNHDSLCLEWLKTNSNNPLWLKHGGKSTLEAYKNIALQEKQRHTSFLEKNLKDYFIDNENRLYVHAGFTNQRGVTNEYFTEMLYWDRTLWETALSLNKNLESNHLFYPKRLLNYSEIFIGHTPVSRINQTTPINAANVWNIDTSAGFKGPLTILDVETKQFWQSSCVYTLYPDETGRN